MNTSSKNIPDKNNESDDIRSSDEMYLLIKNFAKCIKKHGIRKMIVAIKKVNIEDEEGGNYSIIEFIEQRVCKKIGIPKEKLFGFESRGEVTIARKIAMLLINKHIKALSTDEIAGRYNRVRMVFKKAKTEFNDMITRKKMKEETDFIIIYNDVDKEVIEYKKRKNF